MSGGPADPTGAHDLGGIYYAIVTQNDDPDGPGGRVKVRYPWLPEGDRDQSFWAPIAVPMVGAEFGTYTLPEVEDAVMVVFVSGDIHQPVVIGGAWNQVDPPPEVNQDGKNNFRLIRSRAGHRLILDDSGKTKVVLSDVGDHHLIGLGQHKKEGSSPNAMEVPAMGASSGVSATAATGTLNVWCPKGKLTVKARAIEVTASEGADVKGGMVQLKATGSASMGATGSGKLQGAPIKLGVA
ncbi:MAG TPA: phage baseplate assembly protein V [Kofleriaceae bacterium]|nr:phage baseplate assembly protein V [Kofleriaceae bacterium]